MATEEVNSKPIISSGALWYGVLAAPIAWAIRLLISYAMVEWVCTSTQGMLFMHLVSALFLVISLTGAWVAWRGYHSTHRRAPISVGPWQLERSYFMALMGILNSVLFAAVILVEWSVVFFTDPCAVR